MKDNLFRYLCHSSNFPLKPPSTVSKWLRSRILFYNWPPKGWTSCRTSPRSGLVQLHAELKTWMKKWRQPEDPSRHSAFCKSGCWQYFGSSCGYPRETWDTDMPSWALNASSRCRGYGFEEHSPSGWPCSQQLKLVQLYHDILFV